MVDVRSHEYEGSHSITFDCDTPVDDAVEAAGHVPNGYFWEGVAERLVTAHRPEVAGSIAYDCEGGMFCAYGDDPAALAVVAGLLAPVINDPEQITAVIAAAHADGFEFDD